MNSLRVGVTRYRLRHFTQAIVPAVLLGLSLSGPVSAQNLLKMTDQFDQADKESLDTILSKADQCTRARDFACADTKLREAYKFAIDPKSKAALKRSEDSLVTEKEHLREEQRMAEQRQRQQREREELQQRQAAQAAQRQRDAARQAEAEAEEQANLANRVAAAGNAYAQTARAQAANRAAEQARLQQAQQRQADVAASTARDQQRYAQERAQADARRTQLAQNQTVAPATNTSNTTPRNAERPATREPETTREVVKKTSINTGRRAMECVSATRDKEDIGFRNTCGKQIFVVWCGDLKYSKQKCGDGPAGNSYYTHSVNVMPGDTQYARGVGEYRYAACEGGIAFGKDEIQDRPDGSFTCVAR